MKYRSLLSLVNHNIELDWLKYQHLLKVKKESGNTYIFDIIRKKYILLQPEEMVRQLCIIWLIEEQGFSRNSIQVEKAISINGLSRRFDIVVYDSEIEPFILVECKSPHIKISQATFDQLAAYQSVLHAPFLFVTNGINHYIAKMNHEIKNYDFFDQVPEWSR